MTPEAKRTWLNVSGAVTIAALVVLAAQTLAAGGIQQPTALLLVLIGGTAALSGILVARAPTRVPVRVEGDRRDR